MIKRSFSIILVLTFLVLSCIPALANNSSISVSANNNNVNIQWTNLKSITIYRDGQVYKDCSSGANSGAYSTIETGSGTHTYYAVGTTGSNYRYTSDTVTVVGTGKPVISLQYTNNNVLSDMTPRLFPWFKIYNYGSLPLDLSKITVRYWFTINGEPQKGNVQRESSDAKLNPIDIANPLQQITNIQLTDYVRLKFTKMPTPVSKADYFCDTVFINVKDSIRSGYYIQVQPAFEKDLTLSGTLNEDSIRNYKQSDDYSYDVTATTWKENKNICVYYDGQLIWGNEPATNLGSTSLRASVVNTNQVKLDWTSVPNAAGYKILRSTSLNGPYSAITTTGAITSYVDATAVNTNPGTKVTYYYKIIPVLGNIEGAASNISSATIECYISTDYGVLKYNTFRFLNTFVHGAYVPVQIELVLKEDTTNLTFNIDKLLVNSNNSSRPFESKVINHNDVSAFAYSADKKNSTSCAIELTTASATASSSTIKLKGTYLKGQTIKLDVKVKVSAKKEALAEGINKFYSTKDMSPYQINFYINSDKRGTVIKPTSILAQINVNIVNPNVLR